MKIDHIELTNFKNFSTLSVDFAEGVNLFVGGNGSGKTSLLEALSVAVGGFFASQEQKMQRMIEFDEIKITNGKRENTTTITAKNSDVTWSRTINKNTKTNDSKNVKIISDYGKYFFDNFENENDLIVAPLLTYYSTQRLFKDAKSSSKQKYDAANGRRNGYLQCLKENAIKTELNEWLGNAATRRATRKIKEINEVDLVLENVEQAIKKALIYFLNLSDNFSLKIYQEPDFDNEVFVRYDEEHDLPLAYYSDGFRNLIYLIMDLVWRSSQLNPWLSLEEIEKQVAGIVMIDEIDLHLHPKWQAKAIPFIQSLFPRVQFFITTHSPTVVANFETGTLYVIADNQVEKYQHEFFGKQINSILRNVLGAFDRHVPTQEKLNQLFVLIDENNIEKYTKLLQELKHLLGENDVDIVKAEALIAWQNYTE